MSKIERTPHTTKWVPVKELSVIWAEAQRPFDESWAQKIAEDFDPDYFGVVSVTLPNGNGIYHVIDGQHRCHAVRSLFGPEEKIPCNVFPAEDPARAAAIFDKLNTARKSPHAIDRFRVRVTAGNEAEVAVNKIIRDAGYKVAISTEDGTLRAVNACMFVYNRFGAEALKSALILLQATWGKNSTAVDAPLIRGYATFIHRFPKANWQRLTERISQNYTADRFLGQARTIRDMFGGSVTEGVTRALIEAYNRGLKSGRLGDDGAA